MYPNVHAALRLSSFYCLAVIDRPSIVSSIAAFAMSATILFAKSATGDRTERRDELGQHPRRFTVEKGADIVDNPGEERPIVLLGDIAEMRRQHDVVEGAERVIDR
jgi:hypothetical protein